MPYFLCPAKIIVDADESGNDNANPHHGCSIREVGIRDRACRRTAGHVRADGMLPIHRKIAIDGLLAAFSIQRFVGNDILILQAATLVKVGDCLANTCSDL